ncbi:MAG: hypothetical protein DLM61_21170 [Pseudonocardiales bacterium]|nr:MAG: hypothetical protein DLM61_21170 [Pseudonocardiales bacterium]
MNRRRAAALATAAVMAIENMRAALNLAALADQAVHGELRRDLKQPVGNPRKTAMSGNGYCHGKAAISSQGRLCEVATP